MVGGERLSALAVKGDSGRAQLSLDCFQMVAFRGLYSVPKELEFKWLLLLTQAPCYVFSELLSLEEACRKVQLLRSDVFSCLCPV